jgi:hypothetical protein
MTLNILLQIPSSSAVSSVWSESDDEEDYFKYDQPKWRTPKSSPKSKKTEVKNIEVPPVPKIPAAFVEEVNKIEKKTFGLDAFSEVVNGVKKIGTKRQAVIGKVQGVSTDDLKTTLGAIETTPAKSSRLSPATKVAGSRIPSRAKGKGKENVTPPPARPATTVKGPRPQSQPTKSILKKKTTAPTSGIGAALASTSRIPAAREPLFFARPPSYDGNPDNNAPLQDRRSGKLTVPGHMYVRHEREDFTEELKEKSEKRRSRLYEATASSLARSAPKTKPATTKNHRGTNFQQGTFAKK